MTEPQTPRTFISYSLKDGASFAADLRKLLLKRDLSVWQDIVALEGGRDWWSQIEGVLKTKALQHFVLVVTPGALASSVVRREIRLARQEGKTVSPVRGPGLGDFHTLPRWLGQIYDLDVPEHVNALARILEGPSTQRRVPDMAPNLPADFVPRPYEFDALKKQLLDPKGDAVAITAALRGAGGYGKTTLAKALAHDPDIEDAYFDGILWLELGEKPDNLSSLISDLIEILTGDRPGLENITAATAKLGEALGDRRILMIVDDAWRTQDLTPFLHGGPRVTRLITTRLNRVLPSQTVRQAVDAMTMEQARELLSSGLPPDQARAHTAELGALAGRLGEWAQLLRLVNGFLRERVVENDEPLNSAIRDASDRLTEEGLVAFDANDELDRTKAVARTINLSLSQLDQKQRERFGDLAVYPEDADIPLGVVAQVWQTAHRLSEGKTKDLLVKFHSLSLLLDLDLSQRTFRLHDTVRQFLQHEAGKEGLTAQHVQLAGALRNITGSDQVDVLAARYGYLQLPYHLAEAGDRAGLDGLLLDPRWLTKKLAATKNPQALVSDYELYAAGETQSQIGRTVQLAAGICARDPRQLVPQLLGRLADRTDPTMVGFLNAARDQLLRPALLTEFSSLTPPGAETARLEGHTRRINALCVLPDGRLASGSGDYTIRLWDVKIAVETAVLGRHSDGVNALCLLPNGQLASCSTDKTIRLWDLETGTESGSLEGHSDAVNALCVVADGRLASGSSDGTVRLWDVNAGAESACLEGHSGEVNALCVVADGRLASSGSDGTIRLWDLKTGTENARFNGSWSPPVIALFPLPDGRLASGGWDRSVQLWDVSTGTKTTRMEKHSHWVNAICALPDGRLASASHDRTIMLWDLIPGSEPTVLEGHFDWVHSLCALPDGRLASGSSDDTIRLWGVTIRVDRARLAGHSHAVNAICLLPDGRLASCSDDDTIRLWDATTGLERGRLGVSCDGFKALCVLPDGRLATGSGDHGVRLWDVATGAESARLEGHSNWVLALCVLPDGRLASGSMDGTIRLWDVHAGSEVGRLDGHTDSVWTLRVLADGRLASGSVDKTIILWDTKTGTETARLKGKTDVYALLGLPDGRLFSGHDEIQLWDLKTGTETATLETSSWISALCMQSDTRLVSGSADNIIRLWDIAAGSGREIARLEIDARVQCIVVLPDHRLVAGDALGRLHWLKIVE